MEELNIAKSLLHKALEAAKYAETYLREANTSSTYSYDATGEAIKRIEESLEAVRAEIKVQKAAANADRLLFGR